MRRLPVVVLVLALAAAVGVVLYQRSSSTGTSAPAKPFTSAKTPAPPPASVDSEPADLESPREAAVRAVARTGDVLRAGMFSRADVVAQFTTPRFAPTLAADTTTDVNAFVVALGADGLDASTVSVLEVPLTATARAEAGHVTVEVWSVLIVIAPKEPVAREAWRTVTLTMVDVDGRWLVDAWSSSAGPAPAPAPASAPGDRSEVADRLSWPAATPGVA